MDNNELLTVQKYASLNRLSIHTVIKKTMNGELQTVVQEDNGKEVTYILNPKSDKKALGATEINAELEDESKINYKREYEDLHKQYLVLKTKYEKLLQNQQ